MTLNCREINFGDARLLYEWANDPVTRMASFNSDPIEWNAHVEWLTKSINYINRKIYLISFNEKPIGVVRFDKGEKTIIGVNVAPEQRGKGFGAQLIAFACRNYLAENSSEIIFAYIKVDNKASIRAFEKAGFVYFDEGSCNDYACKIFILKNYGKK